MHRLCARPAHHEARTASLRCTWSWPEDSVTPSSFIPVSRVTEKFATAAAWRRRGSSRHEFRTPLTQVLPVVVDGDEFLAALRCGDRQIGPADRHLERLSGACSRYPGRVFHRRYRRVSTRRRRLCNQGAADTCRRRILTCTECTGSLGNLQAAIHECARRADRFLGTWRRLPARLRAAAVTFSIADSRARDATSLTVRGGVNMTWPCVHFVR